MPCTWRTLLPEYRGVVYQSLYNWNSHISPFIISTTQRTLNTQRPWHRLPQIILTEKWYSTDLYDIFVLRDQTSALGPCIWITKFGLNSKLPFNYNNSCSNTLVFEHELLQLNETLEIWQNFMYKNCGKNVCYILLFTLTTGYGVFEIISIIRFLQISSVILNAVIR